ncbi:hypothetical protein [Streptomyces sp. NPDC050560]|uniref:hypothetical protein n=1 Tax=Streptomyces sp. NPDC050560 TaxID=3365630 RepID=UPI0037B10A24
MRSIGRHRDAAAYALGVLGAADAFRFEDHLAQCPLCATRVAAFGPTVRALGRYGSAGAPVPSGAPRAEPLRRLLGEMARAAGAARRRRRAVLGAVLAGAAGAAVCGSLAAAHEPGPERLVGHDGRGGISATVTAWDRSWGTQVGLTVTGARGPWECELVAVGRDGHRETVTRWTVPAPGGDEMATRGSAALHTGEIARFEIRTADGRRLLTLLPR